MNNFGVDKVDYITNAYCLMPNAFIGVYMIIQISPLQPSFITLSMVSPIL